MAIIKYPFRAPAYSAWRDFDEPFNRLARLFDDTSFVRAREGLWSPAVGVTETSDDVILTAELPGLSEDDIRIELENDVLSISGEKSAERADEDSEREVHVWERSHGSFRRSFSLPRTVSADDVTASFDNGVLTVTLPKAAEAKGRTIAISKN